MTKRVAVYVRVSTEEQAEEGFSIAAQTEILNQYVDTQNWTLVRTYADEGISAKNMNRPALQQLLKDVRAGKVDTVLIWKISRLSRSLRDLMVIIELLAEYDVSLISHTEGFDLSTPAGRAMLQITGVFAELERNSLSENVRMGMRRKAREGGWNGSRVYGYDNVDGGLRVNPTEARIVQQIYRWFMAGTGAISICNLLNDQGVRTKRGGHWYVQGVLTILDNPVYKGFVRYGVMQDWAEKRRKGRQAEPLLHKGNHEPIISEEDWETVQHLRQQRRARPTKHRGHYLLSGLLRCPQCGAKMVGWHTSRNGRLFRYYKCSEFNTKGKSVCRGNYVNANRAEHEVLSRLAVVLTCEHAVSELVASLNEELTARNEPLAAELHDVQRQIADVERRIEKLIEAVENGTLPGPTVKERMSIHQDALASLGQHRERLEAELANSRQGMASPKLVWQALSQFHQTLSSTAPDLQKQLLAAIIDRITVTNERVVDQVILAFDPLSLSALTVTFNDDTAHRG